MSNLQHRQPIQNIQTDPFASHSSNSSSSVFGFGQAASSSEYRSNSGNTNASLTSVSQSYHNQGQIGMAPASLDINNNNNPYASSQPNPSSMPHGGVYGNVADKNVIMGPYTGSDMGHSIGIGAAPYMGTGYGQGPGMVPNTGSVPQGIGQQMSNNMVNGSNIAPYGQNMGSMMGPNMGSMMTPNTGSMMTPNMGVASNLGNLNTTPFPAPPTSSVGDLVEPPLLEQLGIVPAHIIERVKSVVLMKNIDERLLVDTDMCGPLAIAMMLGFCLLLAGKIHFGYIYGLGLIGPAATWCLLNLLSQEKTIDLYNTISILGKCPIKR
eukprot:GHVL01033681.1.p1 GENE.GHVL01033681.1~~GHVL01033681.1.p1  ORF type:complete len:323 (-),score=28.20 GHVL01033681.1:337-1305(-)